MSIRVLNTIKQLVAPYMKEETIELRPSADDGLHLVGYDKAGTWREFTCLAAALNFANSEHYKATQAVRP